MAVGSIGGINVKVSADITQFTTAMGRVSSKIGATAKKVRDSSLAYQQWATVGAAAATAVGIAMIKSQMTQLDALAKTSDALKVQQKQLQALQHVAELTGTGAAQLSVNLERMQRRIGEIARKGGLAEAALDEIGLSAKEMINLSADEQLVKISQAMGGMENASIRASIAMDLFGRDGVRMLKMMEQLSVDGLKPTVDELEAMGVALSRVDTAKVEQANDAMFKSNQVLDGITNKFAVKLSPLIEAFSNQLTNAAKETGGFGSTIDSVFSKSLKVVGVFADGLHGIKIVFKGLEVAARAMSVVFWEIFRVITVGQEQMVNAAIVGINSVIKEINKLPGVGLPLIQAYSSRAADMFTDISDNAKAAFTQATDEMHNMAMQPLPSAELDNWVKAAQEASQKIAEAATAGAGVNGGQSTGLTTEEAAANAARIEAIRQSLLTEQEVKQQAYLADFEAMRVALENKSLTQEQFDALAVQRALQHQGELTQIEQDAAKAREEIAEAEKQAKLQSLSGAFNSMAALMNTESKKLFEIGKAAAIAGALVDAYAAVAGAYKVGAKIGGPPLGAAFAAAAGIAQAVNIQNIAKQKIGGAKSMGATASYSGGVPVQNTQSSGDTQSRNIFITGLLDSESRFSGEQVIQLLKEVVGDGADVSFLTSGG
jgi:hypothetical protein